MTLMDHSLVAREVYTVRLQLREALSACSVQKEVSNLGNQGDAPEFTQRRIPLVVQVGGVTKVGLTIRLNPTSATCPNLRRHLYLRPWISCSSPEARQTKLARVLRDCQKSKLHNRLEPVAAPVLATGECAIAHMTSIRALLDSEYGPSRSHIRRAFFPIRMSSEPTQRRRSKTSRSARWDASHAATSSHDLPGPPFLQ